MYSAFDNNMNKIHLQLKTNDNVDVISIKQNLQYENIAYIDFLFDDMSAVTWDEGYILISSHEHVGSAIEDYGLCYYKSRTDTEYVSGILRCPVFGIKKGDQALLIIASGYSLYSRQVISVKNNVYNMSVRFIVEGVKPFENIELIVYHLSGEDADYSGMARTYREHQLKYNGFKKINDRLTSELEYAKDSLFIRVRHGWKPVPTQVPEQTLENEPPMYTACTFAQVTKLVEEYYNAGIRKVEFCLVGWNIRGHDGRWPQIFPVEPALGGEEELLKLIKKAKELGFKITCHTNFTESFVIADCFDIEDVIVDKEGNIPTVDMWAGGRSYSLCPQKALERAKAELPKVAKLGFGGLNYLDVMTCVAPFECYHPEHPVNFREAQECWKEIFRISKQIFGGVSSEGSTDYCLNECDYCLYTSFSRNPEKAWELFDKEVPFWQIVYHGICLYNSYSRTVNAPLSDDKANMLKSFECGDRPTLYYYSKFKYDGGNWMGDRDFLCGTEEEMQEGIIAAKKQYDIFNKLSYLQTCFIEKHSEILPDVYETVYEDGSVITADYNTFTLSLKNSKGVAEFVL